jgi:hypothetical protein
MTRCPAASQLLGEQSRSAADFEHHAVAGAHRGEQVEDTRGARACVERETAVVHEREVTAIVGIASLPHVLMLAQAAKSDISGKRCSCGRRHRRSEVVTGESSGGSLGSAAP